MLRLGSMRLARRARKSNVFGRLDWSTPDQNQPVAQFELAENQQELQQALRDVLPKAYKIFFSKDCY